MNDYKEIIYSILHEANPYEEIEDTTELIESGIVDSLTLVFMVTQLEEMTDKKISEDLPHGITQNVEELLKNDRARLMLGNSELIIMLNQSSTDREQLANLLHISDMEMKYITNVNSGEGLIKIRNSLIPFRNNFPKNNKLYKLMTTKIEETVNGVAK